jgi:hypothetical protein
MSLAQPNFGSFTINDPTYMHRVLVFFEYLVHQNGANACNAHRRTLSPTTESQNISLRHNLSLLTLYWICGFLFSFLYIQEH